MNSMQLTMGEFCRVIAGLEPPIRPRLRGPAGAEDIRSAEDSLGMEFPEELKDFLLCHDGQDFYDSTGGYADPLIPMMQQPANGQRYSHYWLSGVCEIVENTVHCREDLEYFCAEDFHTIGPVRFHDKFLAFTSTENADCLVIDLQPEPEGKVGQIVLYSTQPTELIMVAPDLRTFLQSVVSGYSTGRFRNSECEYFVSYVEA